MDNFLFGSTIDDNGKINFSFGDFLSWEAQRDRDDAEMAAKYIEDGGQDIDDATLFALSRVEGERYESALKIAEDRAIANNCDCYLNQQNADE